MSIFKRKKKETTEDNHLYIRILKYANEHNEFTYNELTKNINLIPKSGDDNALMMQIARGELFISSWGASFTNKCKQDRNIKLNMTVTDKFRLLEYTELKEARESSLSATKQARNALWVSIVALLISIGFSIFEVCTRA